MIIEMLQREMQALGHKEYVKNPCGEIWLGQRTDITYEVGGIGAPNHKRQRRRCNIVLNQRLVVSYFVCEIGHRYGGPQRVDRIDYANPDFSLTSLARDIVTWLTASSQCSSTS